jgi:hypothetical protein
MSRFPDPILTKIKYTARLKVLLAKVRKLEKRERYQLYMSMMGHDPYDVDGEDWAFILHRLVGGSHNVEMYQRRISATETELNRQGYSDAEREEAFREIYEEDPKFLDPILDLVHRKLDDFYKIAGRPDRR